MDFSYFFFTANLVQSIVFDFSLRYYLKVSFLLAAEWTQLSLGFFLKSKFHYFLSRPFLISGDVEINTLVWTLRSLFLCCWPLFQGMYYAVIVAFLILCFDCKSVSCPCEITVAFLEAPFWYIVFLSISSGTILISDIL